MLRQRSLTSKDSRKWEFLHAVVECQIGNVKIDYAKLALKLGYKNERCAQDSYHRFRREHFPEHGRNRAAAARNQKQRFHVSGKVTHREVGTSYRDDDEDYSYTNGNNAYDDDDDDDDGEEEEEEKGGVGVKVKMNDPEMEGAEKEFWSLGFVDLEEPYNRFGEGVKIKMEPGIKKEPVVEEWVWT